MRWGYEGGGKHGFLLCRFPVSTSLADERALFRHLNTEPPTDLGRLNKFKTNGASPAATPAG